MPRKPASENGVCFVVCWIFLHTFQTYFCIQANSMDPDQTAPRGAVWSGSALFAKRTFKTTSRWQSRRQFVIGSLRVNLFIPADQNRYLCKQCRSRCNQLSHQDLHCLPVCFFFFVFFFYFPFCISGYVQIQGRKSPDHCKNPALKWLNIKTPFKTVADDILKHYFFFFFSSIKKDCELIVCLADIHEMSRFILFLFL